VTQRVLRPMVARRSGQVINISPMAGKEGLPNPAQYKARPVFGGHARHGPAER
jgi:NADP-dependent 3-hydroxy acid dehydrogenase YdfG